MDGVKEFIIKLDADEEAEFVAGQSVNGNVTVNLRKPMDIHSINVELIGKGYCYWSEGEADNYVGKENILQKTVRLCGSATDSHSFTFPDGEQTYQFSFQLPDRLPSSFEGSYGYIRYFVKAVIHRHWKSDYKTKLAVKIKDKIDTNLSVYKEGKGGEKQKKVGLLCYKAAQLDMSANIDRGCYCAGESILITSSVTNNTNKDMPLMHAKLVKTVTYTANGKTKKSTDVVARLKGPCVPKGKCASWENEPFDVPQVTPTITNSHVISVQYKMVVKVRVRCTSDPAVKMDVVMGTVPFEQTNESPVEHRLSGDAPPSYHDVMDNDETMLLSSALGLTLPDDVPPRYSAVCGEALCNNISGMVMVVA